MDKKESQDKNREIKIKPRQVARDGRLKLKKKLPDNFACVVKRWDYHFFSTENTEMKKRSDVKENPVLYILIGQTRVDDKEKIVLYAGQTADIKKRNLKHSKVRYSHSLCFSSRESFLSTNDLVFLERGAVAMITGLAEKYEDEIQVDNIANPTASSHYHAAPTMLNPLQMLTVVGIMYSLLTSHLATTKIFTDENKNKEWNGSTVLKAIMVNPDKKAENREEQIKNADRLYDSLRYVYSRRRVKWLRHQNVHKQLKDISNESNNGFKHFAIAEGIAIIIILIPYIPLLLNKLGVS